VNKDYQIIKRHSGGMDVSSLTMHIIVVNRLNRVINTRGVDPLPKLGVFKCDIITWRQKWRHPHWTK